MLRNRSERMAQDRSDDLETVEDLTRPEHLLVWAMRAIALGHEDCPTVVQTFRRLCGANGDQTLQIYVIFIKYLAMTSRRRLQVHVPGCLCMGSDEAAALAIIAAGQRSLRSRDERGLRAALRDLTQARADESLVLVVQGVARLLDASGIALPSRSATFGAPWREPGAAPTSLVN
jgi:hypothetical protein